MSDVYACTKPSDELLVARLASFQKGRSVPGRPFSYWGSAPQRYSTSETRHRRSPHGVLASNAKWRREVVEFGRPPVQRGSSATTRRTVGAPYNRTWAELIRRGLDIDVLECPDCGGRLRFVAAIMLSSAIRRILRRLGLRSEPVELAPARAPLFAGL